MHDFPSVPPGERAGRFRRSTTPEPGSAPGPTGGAWLVTGCAGFVGSHLTEALLDRGCRVIGVDAFTDTYAAEIKRRNLTASAGDEDFTLMVDDLATMPLDGLVEEVDGIFHLAGRPGVRSSWGGSFATYARDNVVASQRLFEAAAIAGRRVVYASSSSVYGEAAAYPLSEDAEPIPVSPYGVTKLTCELLARAYAITLGLDAVGLRYFSVYGPRQRPDMAFSRVFAAIADHRPFAVLGSGRQTRDFTFVGDVVRATLAAMTLRAPGRVYNVGGGCEISLLEALSLCERVAGGRLERRHTTAAAGDARRTIADVARIRSDLGWAPTVPLERGLEAQVGAAEADEPVWAVA